MLTLLMFQQYIYAVCITHEEEKQCQEICDRIGAKYRIRPWED